MAVRAGIQLCNRPEAWIDRLAVREGREATLADRLIAVDLGFVGLVHGARADVLSAQIESIAELMFHAEAPLHEVRGMELAIRNGGHRNRGKAGVRICERRGAGEFALSETGIEQLICRASRVQAGGA